MAVPEKVFHQSAERHGAHSGTHRKSSEYHDGANTIEDASSSGTEEKRGDVGKVAWGNEAEIDDEIED